MTLSVTISGLAEEQLRRWAQQTGVPAEALAARFLERSLRQAPDLASISGEVAERFAQSGMSEDQLSVLLEAEKHASRAERRAKAS